MRIVVRGIVALSLLVLMRTATAACECRALGPALDEFESTDSVIIGRLTWAASNKVLMSVEKVYKGALNLDQEIEIFNGGGGDCTRHFDVNAIGHRYLLYLNTPIDGRMQTARLCGHTNDIERAFDDLALLDNIDKVSGKTRLSGYFVVTSPIVANLEGLSVKVVGVSKNRRYTLTTDRNGFFEVYGLPPDDYVVDPQIPDGWKPYSAFEIPLKASVQAKRHALVRITIAPIYPGIWFTPISDTNKPSWEILPQEAKPGEVILSKRNELGVLSNFAATPFVLDGKRYASVEGFWQMMLYPEVTSDERNSDKVTWKYTREQVAQMTAFEAKAAGTLAEENMAKLGIDWCTYNGKRFPYRSQTPGEHYNLILAAMRAKLEQNPEVKRVLLATGDLVLRADHIQEQNAPPEWMYNEVWMQLRSELQKNRRE